MIKAMLAESFNALLSLAKGMAITMRQMFRRPFTVQYPKERVIWPDRTRGRIVLLRDPETQKHRCTGCQICTRICPNGSLEVILGEGEGARRPLVDYIYHLDRCTFCGLCVEHCSFQALRMSHQHEIAVRRREDLEIHLLSALALPEDKWQGGLSSPAGRGLKTPAAGTISPKGE